MAEKVEAPEARIVQRLTKGDPRRQVIIGAVASPIVVGIVHLLMLVFLEFEAGISVIPSLLSSPESWIPEIAIWLATLSYAAVGLVFGLRIGPATQVHAFRAIGSAIIAAAFFDAGFRMLGASLSTYGLLIVSFGVALSLLVQSYGVRTTQKRMGRALQNGSLAKYFDTKQWTWVLRDQLVFEIDDEDQRTNALASILSRLHWLAPAVGMYIARNTADGQTLLIFGGVFAFVGLILAGGFAREVGVVLQLRDWGREAGRPIQLK